MVTQPFRSCRAPLVVVSIAMLGSPALADDAPTPPNPNGPGSPTFGVPESGGNQAAGALANVDLAKGVAHSSIPFRLPTARGKAQPALSLEYSSTSGQREAGIGWGLALPFIERRNDAGPPLYHDPNPGDALDPTKEDHFTYAGQPLVPICFIGGGSNPNGVQSQTCEQAAPGETFPSWAFGGHYFRLEADGLFARFFWLKDQATWVVQQKNGETMEFGTAMDDATGATGFGNDFDTSLTTRVPTFRWRIVRRYDSMGPSTNPIYYRWQSLLTVCPTCTGLDEGLRYLTDIYDTAAPGSTGGSGPIAFESFAHHVHLSWIAEDDVTPLPGFMPNPMGAALVWRAMPAAVVSRVDVTSATFTSTARHLVRSYALNYYPRGSGASLFERSLLKSVQLTGACSYTEASDGTLPATLSCKDGTLPATTMTYTGIDANLKAESVFVPFGLPETVSSDESITFITSSAPIFWGTLMDVDGDGIADFVGPGFGTCSTGAGPISCPTPTGSYVEPSQHLVDPSSSITMIAGSALGATASTLVGVSSQWAIGNWTSDDTAPGASALWWDAAAMNYQVFTPSILGPVGVWNNIAGTFHMGTLPANTGLASGSPASPLAAFADIDGDGLLDWIRQDPSTGRVTAFFTAQDPVGRIEPLAAHLTSEPVSPLPSGSSNQTFFVDANGDGVPDILSAEILGASGSTNPVLLIWRGHGDATFDTDYYELGVLPGDLYTELAGNNAQLYLHDLNGDGLADLVAYDANGLSFFISTGRSFIAGPTFAFSGNLWQGAFPRAQIAFADLDGSGVDDVVVTWPNVFLSPFGPEPDGHISGIFFDLLGPSKTPQALLSTISNGLGATTTIQYVSSANSANTLSPQVLHVVSSVSTTVADPTGDAGGPYRTDYEYSEPTYDHRYRKFLGYGHVRSTVENDATSRITDTYFQLYDTCTLLTSCLDEPLQAIRGLPTFTSVHDPAGHYLSAAHGEYLLQSLYTGMDGRKTRFAYPETSDTWLFDSSEVASGTTAVTLKDIDDDEGTSNPQSESRNGSYPFPVLSGSGNQAHFGPTVKLETTQQQDHAGNVTQLVDRGVVAGGPLDTPITYASTWPAAGADWHWLGSDTTTSGTTGYARHYEFKYDAHGNLAHASADLKGTRALNRFHEAPPVIVAGSPANASADGTGQILTSLTVDAFGNITQVLSDGGTQCTGISYDTLFAQLPTTTTKFVDGCGSSGALSTVVVYDRGFEAVTQTTDPSLAVTRQEFDIFGRLERTFLPDPVTPGMTDVDADTIVAYTTVAGGPFQIIQTQQRIDDGSSPSYRSSWNILDALGRTAVALSDADAANDPDPRIASSLVVRDATGQVKKTYEPFFSSYAASSSSLPKAGSTAANTFTHDAFGRTVETFQLNGNPESKVVFHALTTESYDATDLAGGTPHALTTTRDGHGRTTETSQATASGGSEGYSSDVIVSSATYLPTGEVVTLTRSDSGGTPYTRSMAYDSLGRMVFNSEPNTGSASAGAAFVYAYDLGGNLVGTSDARGCGVNFAYDGVGRLVSEDYSPCLNSQPAYTKPSANGDGTEVFLQYDTPGVCPAAESGLNPSFVQGQLAAVSDRAEHSCFGYDGRARLASVSKQLAQPGAASMFSLASRYTASWYQVQAAYDEASRTIAQTTGAEVAGLQGTGVSAGGLTSTSLVSATYDNRDIPVGVAGSYGSLVSNEVHEADGLLDSRQYSDAANTKAHCYYNTNRWLTRAVVSRSPSPAVLLDTSYDNYDPVGNARQLTDNRKSSDWPPGALPVSRTLQYDDLYRLRDVTYKYKGGSDVQSPLFGSADLSPLPLSLPANRATHQSYDYDWQNNLVDSRDDADAFFARSVGAATYGPSSSGPNQVRAVSSPSGSATIAYDATGNVISIIEPYHVTLSGEGQPSFQLSYQWDEVGQLASASRADYVGTTSTGTTSLAYTYDATGQRVSRAVAVGNTLIGSGTYYLEIFPSLRVNATTWNGSDYNRDDTTETVYLTIAGASYGRVVYDEAVPVTSVGFQHVYLQVADALGSTSSTVDLASGALVELATYLAYGAGDSDYRPSDWDSFRESYRYTGKEDDYQVGLVYFGQRYFLPALGRWASADPLAIHALAGDMNPYAFATNSPLRFVDPSGLEDVDATASSGGLDYAGITFDENGNYIPPADDSSGVTEAPYGGVGDVNSPTAPTVVTIGTVTIVGQLAAPTSAAAVDPAAALFPTRALNDAASLNGLQNAAVNLLVGVLCAGCNPIALNTVETAIAPLYAPTPPAADGTQYTDELWRSYNSATGVVATGVFATSFVGGEGFALRLGARAAVTAGEAGSFASLDARAVVGDGLTPHHLPQAALGFTTRGEGGALVMRAEEHALTRTYGTLGRGTARTEAGLPFRDVLARDIRDVRQIVGPKYDNGLRQLLQYYYENHPELIRH
jgi:RHS repeat-associated protein